MNVFVLCTGRCGSMTLAKACHHVTNFTAAHESHIDRLGQQKFPYPDNHVEVDNRLSWFLGGLDKAYGDDAIYVHLKRDADSVAKSYAKRINLEDSIIYAYRNSIIRSEGAKYDPLTVAQDYCANVTNNIDCFLENKTHKMEFWIETAKTDFVQLWDLAAFEGDKPAALAEFEKTHNTSVRQENLAQKMLRRTRKAERVLRKLPDFIRRA